MNQKIKDISYVLSGILVVFAAVLYAFVPHMAGYVMIGGVLGFAIVTFQSPYPGKSIRGKRLYGIQVFAVVLMAVSAYLMYAQLNQWVITLLLSAILTLYSAVLLPKELEKENKDK